MHANRLTRKPYMRSDYLHLRLYYADRTARQLAAELGRTPGSLYAFIAGHPELRKQGKI